MKRYNELTVEELAALTEEELNTLMELEFAYGGIEIVNPPRMLPVPEISIKATETAWEVGGCLFLKPEDATAFNKLSRVQSNYDSDYNYKYLKPVDNYYTSISEHKFYKREDLAAAAGIIEEIKKIESINEEAENKYKEFIKNTKGVKNNIQSAWYEAKQVINDRFVAMERFNKYTVLADGNHSIALQFFKDAYKNRQDLVDYVAEHTAQQIKLSI